MTRSEYEYKWKQCHSSSEHVDVCEDYIKSLEQQLSNLKHNYEAQEIIIADYKKRIEELEAEQIARNQVNRRKPILTDFKDVIKEHGLYEIASSFSDRDLTLPYVFDLLYDIKTIGHLKYSLENMHFDHPSKDIYETMEDYGLTEENLNDYYEPKDK